MNKIMKLIRNEEGATALEYGLLAALIAVVIIAAVTALGGEVKTTFTTVQQKMKGANDSAAESGGA